MRYLFFILAFLASSPLWARQPEFPKEFIGFWIDARVGCAEHTPTIDSFFKIERRMFVGYQMGCILKSAPRRKGNTLAVKMNCYGEGNEFSDDMTFALSDDAHVLTTGGERFIRCKNPY